MLRETVSKVMTHIFLKKSLLSESSQDLDEIIPSLFLGKLEQALNPHCLKRYQITHILNVCQVENVFEMGLKNALEGVSMSHQHSSLAEGFITPQYLRISIADKSTEPIMDHFDRAFEFLDSALRSNGKVLVHCHAGISRSSTIVIAYIMYRNQWNLDEAYSHVKSKRPKVNPNPGFMSQLKQFERSNKDF